MRCPSNTWELQYQATKENQHERKGLGSITISSVSPLPRVLNADKIPEREEIGSSPISSIPVIRQRTRIGKGRDVILKRWHDSLVSVDPEAFRDFNSLWDVLKYMIEGK